MDGVLLSVLGLLLIAGVMVGRRAGNNLLVAAAAIVGFVSQALLLALWADVGGLRLAAPVLLCGYFAYRSVEAIRRLRPLSS